ncbi:MAG: S8 family serine peptidase [Pseudonocardiaceae bacterium]
MRRPRFLFAALAVPLIGGVVGVSAPAATATPEPSGETTEFSVLAERGADIDEVEEAITDAGGTVLRSNTAVGLITAAAPATGFTERVSASDAVFGAATAKPIGHAPKVAPVHPRDAVEREHELAPRAGTSPTRHHARPTTTDPLDGQLWGLRSVRSDKARKVEPGSKRVTVGVIDTGVDGDHPDIAPNFDLRASRNFAVDIPYDDNGNEVDGPCEYEGCLDPADVDGYGHGTHVAGTIAAAADGFGISGVAPEVTLVNVRASQDSGYFFLQPTVDAITYAGDAGLDVVNMSFYVDPWLYNCQDNTADSPDQQATQRTIVEAVSRAMDYAHDKGVTQIAALGNQHTDLGDPQPDTSSPDYPADSAHDREIDNDSCLSMPTEGPHAIGVSSYGPSKAKAGYSNYGLEQISVSAPGGFYRDHFGTPEFRQNENMILSAYPREIGVAQGNIDADGTVTDQGEAAGVQRATGEDGRVGYYRFSQGTSMAAPHATGVAALIVSRYGRFGRGGFGMDPDAVRRVLEGTAAETACPEPRTVDYLDEGRDESFTATCAGEPEFNGFYGHGTVDAFAAVTRGAAYLRP